MASKAFKEKLHNVLKAFEDTRNVGYVPDAGNSGVTIATGLDLSTKNKAYIDGLNISDELKEKLTPYLGVKDPEIARNLVLTDSEVDSLDNAVIDTEYNNFTREFKNSFGEDPKNRLDENTLLGLSTAYFNMGAPMWDRRRNPSMRAALASNNKKLIHAETANFHRGAAGQPISRRLVEASLMAGQVEPTTADITALRDTFARSRSLRNDLTQNWNRKITPVTSNPVVTDVYPETVQSRYPTYVEQPQPTVAPTNINTEPTGLENQLTSDPLGDFINRLTFR